MSVISSARLLAVSGCLFLCACSETVVKDVPDATDAQGPELPQPLAQPLEQSQDPLDALDPPDFVPAIETQQIEEPSANPMVTIPAAPAPDIDANEPGDMSDTETLAGTDTENNTTNTDTDQTATSTSTEQTSGPDSTNQLITPDTTDQTSTSDNVTDLLADPVTDTVEVNPAEVPVPATDTIPDMPLQQPATEMIVGEPGSIVDCQQQIPCRWISDDSQFHVTVTNADNIASRGRLSIEFSIDTVHDTQVSIARSESALDASGIEFEPTDQVLGNGNGGIPQGIVAGTAIGGTLNFDKSSSSDSVTQWAIRLIDGGIIRNASFKNIKIGSITTQYADCNNILPCIWASPDSTVTVTLLSAGGITTANRLSASFSVKTTSNQTVALDSGATGVGIDGTQFIARTHVLGSKDGFEKIVANTIAGAPLSGIVNFFRTPVMPASLQDLSLILYEDRPVPRWNPRFTAVPIQ